MDITWLEKEDLFPTVLKKLQDVDIVLDIGCGIIPQTCVRPSVHICCEPFEQYVELLQKKINNEYDRTYVILKATWQEAVRLFPPKSVDTVFLIDVIEHLEKEEVLRLLKETEALVKKQITVFTPLGFLPQHHLNGKDAWGLDGGAWQEHKSGWQPEDFHDSWDIYACRVFHITDNQGIKFETPFGAMWAIRTLDERSGGDREISVEKEKIHMIIDRAVDNGLSGFLRAWIVLLRLVLKIKSSKTYRSIFEIIKKRSLQ